jgi:hypothetical protein
MNTPFDLNLVRQSGDEHQDRPTRSQRRSSEDDQRRDRRDIDREGATKQ